MNYIILHIVYSTSICTIHIYIKFEFLDVPDDFSENRRKISSSMERRNKYLLIY